MGPVRKDRISFFTDYQGTQTVEGISSRVTSMPSLPERAGNFDDVATTLTGVVRGPATARLLSLDILFSKANEPAQNRALRLRDKII